jgi:hypothetical protein
MNGILRIACICSMLLAVGGCNVAGALWYKVAGPPKVPAKYKPDKKAPLLVLAENLRTPSASSADADMLARYVGEELAANKVAPIVDLDKLRALRDERGNGFAKLSVTAIGRNVGAQQVLYIQVTRNLIKPFAGDNSYTGDATAVVKLIDARTGDTLWPRDVGDGHEVSTTSSVGLDRASSETDVRQHMYRDLAYEIGRLFYAWQPEDEAPESYEQ